MNILKKKPNVDYYLTDEEFRKRLYGYAFNLNKGNVQNSLDLVQDVIVLLKTKYHLYKSENNTPFIGWAISIMRNQFINNYRRQQQTNSFIHSYDADTEDRNRENVPSHYSLPDDALEDKERLASIEEIKQIIYNSTRLRKHSKQAILLKMEGEKIKDIAKKLNIPFNTAKGAVYTEIRKVPEFDQIKNIFYTHYDKQT